MVEAGRIELLIQACKASVIPFNYAPINAVVSGLKRNRNCKSTSYPTLAILRTLLLAIANPELQLWFLGSPPRGHYQIRSTLIYLGSCLPRLYWWIAANLASSIAIG